MVYYTLKEILEQTKLEKIQIMVRVIFPPDLQEKFGEYDSLFGYCHYENGELFSDDGDSYSLDDKYCQYELSPDLLIVWYEGRFI